MRPSVKHWNIISGSLLLVGVVLLFKCTQSTGLQPVSGVEGTLRFQGAWPDSIKGAALVALDEIPTDLSTVADHLISYSTPAQPPADSSELRVDYFIQLEPGTYFLITLGLTIDPGLFATRLDSFKLHGNWPVVTLEHDLETIGHPIFIQKESIQRVNRTVAF